MDYYKKNYKEYIKNTFNVNMSTSYKFFLKYVKDNGSILDIGFGSGRDSLYFKNKGYKVTSIDPVKEFCEHAIEIGLKNVRCIKVEDIKYRYKYDAIWACASLLHLDNDTLIDVLNKCYVALKKNGVMYLSFKYGDNNTCNDSRFYNNMNDLKFKKIFKLTRFNGYKYKIKKDIMHRNNLWFEVLLIKHSIS